MKTNIYLFIFFLSSLGLFAQAPQLVNYQGVARDGSGNVLPNQSISLRLSVLSGSPTGQSVYTETHDEVMTNQFGLYNVHLGGGTVVSGNFATIDWGSAAYYFQTEFDPNGGVSFGNLGQAQLVSVPYALYAETSNVSGNSSADYTVNADENDNEWFTIQIPPISEATTSPWTISGINSQVVGYESQGCHDFYQTGINAHPLAISKEFITSMRTGNTLQFGGSTNLRLKFSATGLPGIGTTSNHRFGFIGFASGDGARLGDITQNGTRRIGFAYYDGSLYSVVCNGTSITTNNLGAYTSSSFKRFEIVLNGVDNVLFYINGMLVNTTSTSIPSNLGCLIIVKGDTELSVADAGFDFVGHFILSEKLD